jgi:hypothetical protein
LRGTQARRGQSSQSGQLGTQTQMLSVLPHVRRVAGVDLGAAGLRIEVAVAVGVDERPPAALGELDHLIAAGDHRGTGGSEHGAQRRLPGCRSSGAARPH